MKGREDYFWTLPAPCSGFNLLGNIGVTACVCAQSVGRLAWLYICTQSVRRLAWLYVCTQSVGRLAWLYICTQSVGRLAWLHMCTQPASGHLFTQSVDWHDCTCIHTVCWPAAFGRDQKVVQRQGCLWRST
jgi:hypothetical protein